MHSFKEPFVKHLVVDAGAFLKSTSLESIGENIYSTQNVIKEIRDSATRQRLQVLPYELHYVDPTPESLAHVTEFAKKTGDFPSLSVADLGLIAAVYQLEKEHGDIGRLRTEPVITKTYGTTKKLLENPKDVVGFFLPPMDKKEPDSSSDVTKTLDNLSLSSPDPHGDEESGAQNAADGHPKAQETVAEDENENNLDKNEHGYSENDDVSESNEEEESETEHDDEEEEAENEDDGWITPGNIQKALSKMRRDQGGMEDGEQQSIVVACISADFAVQNVLLHMGLRLVSADGILIKRLRTYVLRCFGCFKTTSVMTSRFCPSCGHPTLKKVAVTVNPETGTLEYHLSTRKRISVRGTKFSLPTFKGGKHAKNPILTADQPVPENRLSKKATQRLDVLDPDYVGRDSPFLMKDVTSRSAVLGIRSIQKTDYRRNPNDWSRGRKRGGKKR